MRASTFDKKLGLRIAHRSKMERKRRVYQLKSRFLTPLIEKDNEEDSEGRLNGTNWEEDRQFVMSPRDI